MKILKKQTNSKDCLICGVENELGLNAPFYEMESGEVYTLITFKHEHQSYPGRVHGGMISALLDELIGRAIWIKDPNIWGVTITLEMKFRKPVPLGVEHKGIGRIDSETSRTFTGSGEIYDTAGNVLASAKAVYMKLPLDKIAEGTSEDVNILYPDDLTEIE